tara:strand:- start:466 stop:3516 length:3051 start_codon:yes stop_codon:yes gene_type:complete
MMNIYFVCSPNGNTFCFGQTTRTFIERHKDPDWNKLHTYLRAMGEDINLLEWYEDVDIEDHDIHRFLKTVPGIPFPSRGEWSNYDKNIHTLDSIKSLVEKRFFIKSTKKVLKLRPHQENFVTKILSRWEQWKEFLLFAKCRAGKSIMTFSAIVDANVSRTLVVSRFNSPKQSWIEDCQEYDKFRNVRIINLYEDNWQKEYDRWKDDTSIQIVFWSTIQGLCSSKCKKLVELSRTTGINLLVFDECHIGEDADQFKKVRNKFNNAKCLKVSGTAYDQAWQYSKDNRFVYSYWDEQLYYKGQYPKMNVHTIAVDVNGYREIFGNDPDAFTNIFHTNEDGTEFIYPDLVSNFWNKYFTTTGQRHIRNYDRTIVNRNHIVASLPSVAACQLSLPYIKEYAPLVITGESGHNSDTINKFVNENTKTICLTVQANILGVTCKKWDCVVHLWGGSSIEKWNQLSFRGGSGTHDWDVIDFAPRRAIKCLDNSLVIARVDNEELLDYKMVDFVDVFEWNDGFVKLSDENIIDILSVDIKDNVQRTFENLAKSISDERLLHENLDDVSVVSDTKPQSSIVSDNDTNEISAKKKIFPDGELTKKEKNEKRDQLKNVLNSIPLVLTHAIKSGNNIRTVEELLLSKFYIPITQDTQSVVSNLIETKDINPKDITTMIHQNNPIIEKNVHKDFTKTLDSFRITKATQQVIPLNLLKILFKNTHDYVLIVGDPSGSCCSYVIEHLGVPPSNIWVWENHSTHRFLIQSISSEINILNNIEDYKMNKAKTYCIGNPPYSDRKDKKNSNKKEWKNHLFNAMSKAKTTSFIVPASVISPSTHFDEIRPYLSYINTDVKKYFPGVGSTFVVITVEDSQQDKCLVETDEGSLEISLLDIRILPKVITKKNIEYVNSILTGGREWKVKCEYHSSSRKKWEDLEGNIEILHTSTKSFFTNKDIPLNHTIRVAVTKSGKAEFKVIQNKGLSESMIFTDGFETIEDAQKYCDFCNSDEIQEVLELSKFSGWNTKELLKNIP